MDRTSMLIEHMWFPLLTATVAAGASLGVLALVSPKTFSSVALYSSQWVDSNRVVALLDRRIDIDRFVLGHSRIFGTLVLVAVAVLVALLLGR